MDVCMDVCMMDVYDGRLYDGCLNDECLCLIVCELVYVTSIDSVIHGAFGMCCLCCFCARSRACVFVIARFTSS